MARRAVQMDSPFTVFVLSFAVLWISAQSGVYLRTRGRELELAAREDLVTLLTATLTLLALIIGFTFSMAVTEYDQRRNSEQTEANVIGTEYIRLSLLQPDDARKIRELLTKYMRQRILFYTKHDTQQLQEVDAGTSRLQADLWSAMETVGMTKSNPVVALVISGMNDVLSSQTSAQAEWWNRVPLEAWILMGVIAISGNFLVGYTARCNRMHARRFFLLPLLISIAFFLIADLDNPRHGMISINPRNLVNLSRSISVQ